MKINEVGFKSVFQIIQVHTLSDPQIRRKKKRKRKIRQNISILGP
jgi:hypothetical protein